MAPANVPDPQRPAASSRVSDEPLPPGNQPDAQPMPTSDHEAAPSSGSTARTDPQSPQRAGSGEPSSDPTRSGGEEPDGAPGDDERRD